MGRVTGIGGVFFRSEDPEELYRTFEELRERFERSRSPGEALASEFEGLAEEAEEMDKPGIEVLARKAERYASHIRTGFPPLED